MTRPLIGTTAIVVEPTALSWVAGLRIDADGSPKSYAPPPLRGLDHLGNAHVDPRDLSSAWCGVVLDKNGKPIVQGPNEPAPGYYVSPTALGDPSFSIYTPRRYVDSETVPYLAVPPDLLQLGCKLGDLAFAARGDTLSWAIVADVGPRRKIGEGSIALAEALGIPSSPRNGGVSNGVASVVFLGSSKGWHRDLNEARQTATGLLEAWGGAGRLTAICA